ncbi:MAG: polyprenyl synthetase family protein [Bacteroidales bacterium]|nr:polyprenyl synthetase family protein [Bacteroidales bacterium]
MHSIKYFQELFNERLAIEKFDKQPIELYKPISYTFSLGGKRLRPVLALLACDLFEGIIENAINPAIGIELFHNFTLLHDDIMDNAPIRRGKETVYKKWNQNIAILSGDTMFVLAYEYLMQTDSKYSNKVFWVMSKTAREVCEGQQYDMNFEKQSKVSISEYLNMIRLKTAVLLAASLKIGAIIGNANEQDADYLYNFGINIGMLFQIKDDLLDAFGDEEKFGKKSGGDIISNKKTYLFLKAMELASDDDLNKLKHFFANTDFDENEKINSVTEIYKKLKIDELAKIEMENYFLKAIENLNSISVKDENKKVLSSFAEKLMRRQR